MAQPAPAPVAWSAAAARRADLTRSADARSRWRDRRAAMGQTCARGAVARCAARHGQTHLTVRAAIGPAVRRGIAVRPVDRTGTAEWRKRVEIQVIAADKAAFPVTEINFAPAPPAFSASTAMPPEMPPIIGKSAPGPRRTLRSPVTSAVWAALAARGNSTSRLRTSSHPLHFIATVPHASTQLPHATGKAPPVLRPRAR